MRGVVMHGPGDVRVEESMSVRGSSSQPMRSSSLPAACVCGSDLWPYRGIGVINHTTQRVMSTWGSSRRWAMP